MPDIFDLLFGSGARSIRREAQARLTTDDQGNPTLQPMGGEVVALSPDGSLDRVVIAPDRFFHCGCSAEGNAAPGGRCAEPGCARVSCPKCFVRCRECGKPLCLIHLHRLAVDHVELPLCHRCHGVLSRRHFWRRVLRGLISPFINPTSTNP